MFLGPALFTPLDTDQDGSLVRSELEGRFGEWFVQWDKEKAGVLDEAMIRDGLNAALPPPQFGGPGRGFAGPGGRRGESGPGGGRPRGGPRGGGPGFGGPSGGGGVELDPLVAIDDPNKPLVSKLLAVPSLRAKYLAYVRDIAETWLDWKRLGPRVREYQALINAEVKADTRKLDTYEAFLSGVADDLPAEGDRGGSLRGFADQRRAYLMKATAP
jgi:hypothetical protein